MTDLIFHLFYAEIKAIECLVLIGTLACVAHVYKEIIIPLF